MFLLEASAADQDHRECVKYDTAPGDHHCKAQARIISY